MNRFTDIGEKNSMKNNLIHYTLLNNHKLHGDEFLAHPQTNEILTSLEWARIYTTKQCREFNLFEKSKFADLIPVDLHTATIIQFNSIYFHHPLKSNDTNRQEATVA